MIIIENVTPKSCHGCLRDCRARLQKVPYLRLLVMIRVRWIAISFVMRQGCFSHLGMFSFLHRECIDLHEGRLRNKMHLHSTLKGFFLC